jgi:hypothetical protein
MLEDPSVMRNSVDRQVEAVSRRALLTASAGLLGATALASGAALAQAPAPPPTMPASQAPIRNDWLAKRGGADGVLHHLQAERPTAGEVQSRLRRHR